MRLAMLLLVALAGCDHYHNPSDTAKIRQLQSQLSDATDHANAADLRADIEASQIANQGERLTDAAERSAQAQEWQAISADQQATAAQDQAMAEATR